MANLFRVSTLVLLTSAAISAAEVYADDAKSEAIRQALIERFEKQRRIHVAYTLDTYPGTGDPAIRETRLLEVFRDGKFYGIHVESLRGGSRQDAWFATDGTRVVLVTDGAVAMSLRGPDVEYVEVKRAQAVLDSLCEERKLPAVALERPRTVLRIRVDERDGDEITASMALEVGLGVGASWLEEELFSKKEVAVDSTTNQVILTSKRARMCIDRSTGLLISGRARKAGTGRNLRLVRRSVELDAKEWKPKIRSLVAIPGAQAGESRMARSTRVYVMYNAVSEITERSPDAFEDPKRLREVTERLAAVVLGSKAARADVAAMVESERGLAASRAVARKSVTDAWLEPMKEFIGTPTEVQKRADDAVEAAVRRYAEKHFDAVWPAAEK